MSLHRKETKNTVIIISILSGVFLAVLAAIIIFFNLPSQRIRRMLKTANKYIAEENYDEAILIMQKMIKIDPKNEKLYLILADTYENSGDIDKEISLLQAAAKALPDSTKLSDTLEQLYLEANISESENDTSDDSQKSDNLTDEGQESNKKDGLSTTALTGQWISDEYYWTKRYQRDDGTYPVNQWEQIDGNWYYFDGDGWMLKNSWIQNKYYVGSDGAMIVNGQTTDGFMVDSEGVYIPGSGNCVNGTYKFEGVKLYEDNYLNTPVPNTPWEGNTVQIERKSDKTIFLTVGEGCYDSGKTIAYEKDFTGRYLRSIDLEWLTFENGDLVLYGEEGDFVDRYAQVYKKVSENVVSNVTYNSSVYEGQMGDFKKQNGRYFFTGDILGYDETLVGKNDDWTVGFYILTSGTFHVDENTKVTANYEEFPVKGKTAVAWLDDFYERKKYWMGLTVKVKGDHVEDITGIISLD